MADKQGSTGRFDTRWAVFALAVVVVLLDQWSKDLAIEHLSRSARWYLPGSARVREALQTLGTIAREREAQGDGRRGVEEVPRPGQGFGPELRAVGDQWTRRDVVIKSSRVELL